MLRFPRASARRLVAVLGVAALAAAGAALSAVPAAADTAPSPPTTATTVSADALPTVQVNGVVWSQVIVGNRVYVTGEFTSARPAGAAAGTNETPRSNLLAFDLTTGALIPSWAPTLNATGQTIAASPDGSRIYVAGSFTNVSGVNRYRLVALDANTGAVITSFAPSFNARTRSLAVGSDGTVYVGGIFTVVNNQPRTRLAAIAANGTLLPWAPAADKEVLGLAAPAGSGKVFAGGKFFSINGDTSAYGLAMIDGTSGALLPFSANNIVRNAGDSAAIYHLSTDGARVYGVGYTFGGGGNFEGSFSADVATGALTWVTGCRGDTYASAPGGGVLYYVGHVHDCASIGGNPQTDPWTFQYAYAQVAGPSSDGRVNQGGTFGGQPAPELLHWLPTLTTGTYTGQTQAGWAVAANDDYVVLGGEFPRVNGTNQQGLVRFAVRSKAPNTQGAQGGNDMNPTLISLAPGTVRVSWKSAWDRDNRRLSYQVLRGPSLGSSVPIGTIAGDSAWWDRPPLAFTDTSATPGSTQTYRIRVTDPLGNVVTGNPTSIAVPSGGSGQTPYGDAVRADSPTAYWPLGEATGAPGYDWVGADDLTVDGSATRGADGAILSEPTAAATTFAGSAQVPAAGATLRPGPDTFTTEAWIKTTTTSGGKIIGFGNNRTGDSSGYDRHVYMRNDGRLVFGVYDNGVRTLATAQPYNDGQWHQVVATMDGTGMTLYVDGKKVGARADTVKGQPYSGYWRVGGDNLGGWPDQPASKSFAGTIDDVAVYPASLSAARVAAHWTASGRTVVLPQRPADAYGAAVWDDQPGVYWRHDETSGTAAVDTTTLDPSGTYTAGVQLGETGVPGVTGGKAITLPGGAQTVVATQPTSNPTVFSLETWIKTSTTTGGRIIGFGNAGSGGTSGNYDRHVYMFDDGRVRFGIWTGSAAVIDTPASYNDGQWHQIVATQGPAGMALYVDGALIGTHDPVTPQAYDGFWRVGSDSTWGGSSTNDFSGVVDETAVYPAVLSAARVQRHWELGSGTAVAPNQAPTAAFTSTATDLSASFNGGGSTDADGTVESYAWDFGDGTTATGATVTHPYAAADTYSVKLTVTDDDGATGTVTKSVTVTAPPVPNQAPTAAFTSTVADLTASLNASGSSDADGTIVSYAWNFGDATTGVGATVSHPYTADGTYTVTLTVTDDDGAIHTVAKQVTVAAAPPADPAVARDNFGRAVASGLGTADLGGPWTVSASGIAVSVADGAARLSMPAGRTGTARLGSVSVKDVDLLSTMWLDAAPTGGGVYLSSVVRGSSAGEYRSRVRVQADGKVLFNLSRVTGGTETAISTQITVAGLTYTPGTKLLVRTQAVGTTIRARIWVAGSTEPTAWLQSVTDTTAALQVPGWIGIVDYASSSATAAHVVRHDDLVATAV
jgi:trimeric autotransporter adhesin